MTDAELDALAQAVEDLGERVVQALSRETGRPVEDFDTDPRDHEYSPSDDVGDDGDVC